MSQTTRSSLAGYCNSGDRVFAQSCLVSYGTERSETCAGVCVCPLLAVPSVKRIETYQTHGYWRIRPTNIRNVWIELVFKPLKSRSDSILILFITKPFIT